MFSCYLCLVYSICRCYPTVLLLVVSCASFVPAIVLVLHLPEIGYCFGYGCVVGERNILPCAGSVDCCSYLAHCAGLAVLAVT